MEVFVVFKVLIYYHCYIVIDCGNPGKPRNGIVIGNDYRFGATVEYKCINGYILVGVKSRYCQEDGTWSSDRPFCKGKMLCNCIFPYPDRCGGVSLNLCQV